MISLLEYSLQKPKTTFRIVTDIGPFKSIVTELPFNISEICGHSPAGSFIFAITNLMGNSKIKQFPIV